MEKEQGLSEVFVFTGAVRDSSEDGDYMGLSENVRHMAAVPAEILEAQIDSFVSTMGQIISKTSRKLGEFRVSEIRIQAEITGEGKIGIAGLGASAEGSAGIVFIFERE